MKTFSVDVKKQFQSLLDEADAIVVGAGSGLSTAAGFTYSGARFERYFRDFIERFGIRDMYSGGFYPFPDAETFWGWWCRHIWVNRYAPLPSDLYERLLQALAGRDFFILTTNVDHAFQRAGFQKKRLFYTQGDYGLFQSSEPAGVTSSRTYDNKDIVEAMLRSEGWSFTEDGALFVPKGRRVSLRIDASLVPFCPDDGAPMTMNLRSDDSFVEDGGWRAAAERYRAFLDRTDGKRVLFLELGVGQNTPGIIKYPFWRMTEGNPNARYVCVNPTKSYVPDEIEARTTLFVCGADAVV